MAILAACRFSCVRRPFREGEGQRDVEFRGLQMSASTTIKSVVVCRTGLPQRTFRAPETSHGGPQPLRIDSPILRGQQSRTSSGITNSINRKRRAERSSYEQTDDVASGHDQRRRLRRTTKQRARAARRGPAAPPPWADDAPLSNGLRLSFGTADGEPTTFQFVPTLYDTAYPTPSSTTWTSAPRKL